MMVAQHLNTAVRFGKYLLLDRIAAGGMAELFLAKQTGLSGFEKAVAIKRILPMLTKDPEFVNMFINEAKLAALLSHQNIAQIFDLGTTEGFYYIAMEYIMGKDLRTVVQRGQTRALPLPVGHALLIASRISSGLNYAHRKKDLHGRDLQLVHRDVSPQNILISYEGDIKLVDFGIAKAATQTNETRTGTLKGKLAYMSPEQAMGKPLDHRSDIFSLGIVMHELVTGRRLFTGANELALLDQVRQAEITPPSRINADIPTEVDQLIMKALAKEPVDRFQDASEMELAIEQVITAKSYAFSSLSLANYMHTLFEQDLAEDTIRLQRVAAITTATSIDQSTVVRPAVHASAGAPTAPELRAAAASYDPLTLRSVPRPATLPLTKRLLVVIAAVCWLGLLAAMWRPDLVPWHQIQELPLTLRQQGDQLVARLAAWSPTTQPAATDVDTPAANPPPPLHSLPAAIPAGADDPAWQPVDPAQNSPEDVMIAPGTLRLPLRAERRRELQRLYQEARRAYQTNDLAMAERRLRTALAINPQAAHGYHLLATVLHEQKKTDASIAVLTEGVHRFPGNAALHYDLGQRYAESNVSSLAIDELRLALSLEASAPWAGAAADLLRAYGATPPEPPTHTTMDPIQTEPDARKE